MCLLLCLQIHIIPEAVEELDGLVDFPIGGATILFGLLALILLDNALLAAFAPTALARHAHTHAPGTKDASDFSDAGTTPSHSHQCLSNTHAQHVGVSVAGVEAQQGKHVHGKVGSAGGALAVMRQKVAAYSMELGCIFHSIIIGEAEGGEV